MEAADALLREGRYEEALKAYEDVFERFPAAPPGDRALFSMGLAWAHPDNPDKDTAKALACFRRLPDDFPASPLKDEAGVMADSLEALRRCQGRLNHLQEQVDTLKERLDAMKRIDIGIEEKKRKDLPQE